MLPFCREIFPQKDEAKFVNGQPLQQKELSRQGLSPSKKRWQPMAPCKVFGWNMVLGGGL